MNYSNHKIPIVSKVNKIDEFEQKMHMSQPYSLKILEINIIGIHLIKCLRSFCLQKELIIWPEIDCDCL